MIELFNIKRLKLGTVFTFLIVFFLNLAIDFESNSKSIVLNSMTFIGLFLATLYYSFGRLKYKLENDFLILTWSDKLLYKQKDIDEIFIRDIKSLVVDDENEYLLEIRTKNKKITLGNNGIRFLKLKNDGPRLIQDLTNENPKIEIIDRIDIQLKSPLTKILLIPLIWIMVIGSTIKIIYDLFNDFSFYDLVVLLVIIILFWPMTIFITVLSLANPEENSNSSE